MRRVLGAMLGVLALAPVGWSFCGFYVAQEPGSLFNQSSKVVLVRDGDRTVLTMANDYRGDPAQFGLVVPVPQEITPDMVRIADPGAIERLDQYTVPRLAEYFDDDPCPSDHGIGVGGGYGIGATGGVLGMLGAKGGGEGGGHGVRVAQQYSLEEYDIVVIEAEHGEGLEAWLRQEGYQIPDGATAVLESYVRQGMHFFLAKIDLAAQAELGVRWPRPLRVTFTSPKFGLPIRLGTVNADGPQDLLVFALTASGRVETTNYRTVRVPTDVEVPEYLADPGNFAPFYNALFERKVRRDDMRAVYLEYAWPLMQKCDPCAGPMMSGADLASLGAQRSRFVTRLHVRYDGRRFPEDLVFQETEDRAPWQARYVVHHRFAGDTSCAEGRRYEETLASRQASEVANLVRLTGWDAEDIAAFVPPAR